MAAALAQAGHSVIGVDQPTWHGWPDEPGLYDLLDALPLGDQVICTYDYQNIANDEASLIVVPTPSRPDGSFTTDYVLEAVRSIVKVTDPEHLIVVCSTVSPGRTFVFTNKPPCLKELYWTGENSSSPKQTVTSSASKEPATGGAAWLWLTTA